MKAYLIDGNSFCYRAFYAIKDLRTSYGQPTNAAYGFVTILNSLIDKEHPDYLTIAFDLKAPTFRHKAFSGYKSNRKPMPDELVAQLPVIRRIIEGFRVPVFEKEGFEADDILGTLAKKIAGETVEVYIVTGDKDMLQLVNSHIKVYNIHKEGLIYDEKKVRERFKVEPSKIPDIMALMGDGTDNIPGVKGIGEKGAIELINEFGSLDRLFDNIDKVKNKAQSNALRQYKEDAILSKNLAILDLDVPIKVSLEELKVSLPDRAKLMELFKELEFKSLLKELLKEDSTVDVAQNYKILSAEDEIDRFVKRLLNAKEFSFDIKTDTENAMTASITGIAFSLNPGEVYYLDKSLASFDLIARLKPVFENETIDKTGTDLKFKKVVLRRYGIELKAAAFDIILASYLLNYQNLHNIEDFLNLRGALKKELEEKGLSRLFNDIEMPLIDVLADMEFAGIGIDCAILKKMSDEMERELLRLRRDIIELAGCDFNINSPKQLSNILFERLKLPVIKRTKTGPSTDVEVLKNLSAQHPLPGMLLDYRELMKLKTTYIDVFPALVLPSDKRLHTSFNQAVTATGRLSSSEPNLQNIPIRSELGRRMRKAFIAAQKNSLLLSADYSQIELRILAHLSKDSNLIRAFKEGADIHRFSASLIYGVKPDDVTQDMRDVGKTINFAVIYGMSDYGLARELNIDLDTANKFISSYFDRYPKVKEYIESQIESCKEKGYVTTIFGRRRYIPDINSGNSALRGFAQRTAINTPVQGSAADMIKVAMINIHRSIKDADLKTIMVLQVHDELLFEVPEDEMDKIKKLILHHMVNAVRLCVPIEVSIKTGANWQELC